MNGSSTPAAALIEPATNEPAAEAAAAAGIAGDDGLVEPTRIVLVRHGETDWNAQLRLQGHTDQPLNERGRWQAARAAEALAGEGLTHVYSSDLARARQTAEALAQACGIAEVGTDPALRERSFGHFEGRTYAELEAQWPDDVRRWRSREPGFAPGGGESPEAFCARCVPGAAAIAARHPGRTVALVAHGGVLDCLYRAAAGIDLRSPRTWQLGNASINRLLFSGRRFVLVGWNDDAHLRE